MRQRVFKIHGKAVQRIDLPGISRKNDPQASGKATRKGGGGLRLLKIAEEIRRYLNLILRQNQFLDPELGRHLINITHVRVTPDLRQAFVSLTALGDTGEDLDPLIQALNTHSPSIRFALARMVDLRMTPALTFERDTHAERAHALDTLLVQARHRSVAGDGA